MAITAENLSVDALRAYLQSKRDEEAAKQAAHEAEQRAERDKLQAEFMERDIQPEAMERVAGMIRKAVDRGEKRALILRFPSEWLPDQGRGITSHDPNWHERLEAFPRKAYDFYKENLEPRGFLLQAEILDYPGGIPGDAGFFLAWPAPEEQ